MARSLLKLCAFHSGEPHMRREALTLVFMMFIGTFQMAACEPMEQAATVSEQRT